MSKRKAPHRIAILARGHLCTNPRVVKEAETLGMAGYEVTVLGAWLQPELKACDRALLNDSFRFVPVADFTTAPVRWFAARASRKLAQLAHDVGRVESSAQLGYAGRQQAAAARRCRADLYIAHHEQSLALADALLRDGQRVAVDMEDWFSEDLLPPDRARRPLRLLRRLERRLLRRGAYATCPSAAMSQALAEEYQAPAPRVVYNAFSWAEGAVADDRARDRREARLPSLHWFSQTLGAGRGLEELLLALPYLSRPMELHLRGTPAAGYADWIRAHVPEGWRERVFLHDTVPPRELLPRIAEHDIGFAGEMSYCRSRQLTVTNKILQYLLGGLAVVASDTAGQREVARQASGAVLLYPSGEPAALAQRIEQLAGSPEALRAARAAALAAARETFSWERQQGALLDCVASAVGAA